MMEILKVRVWNTRSIPPCMMYWGKDFFDITFKNGHLRIGNSPGNKYFELHVLTNDFFRKNMPSCQGEVILMVSTGLQDKNDEEIWEGDVLLHEGGKIKEVVEWKKEMWTEEGFMTGFGERFGTANQYERIGNIYENPKLLKKKPKKKKPI